MHAGIWVCGECRGTTATQKDGKRVQHVQIELPGRGERLQLLTMKDLTPLGANQPWKKGVEYEVQVECNVFDGKLFWTAVLASEKMQGRGEKGGNGNGGSALGDAGKRV